MLLLTRSILTASPRLVLAFGVAFFLCTALWAEPARDPTLGGFGGMVRTPDGAGIAGAEVVATAGGGEVHHAVTGEHGVYRIGGLEAGDYTLELWLAGARRVSKGPLHLARGEARMQDFELSLEFPGDTLEVLADVNRDHLAGGELRDGGATDVGEALYVLPGLWKVRKGGIASDVVLRGYQGENLNVLIDGVRVQGACPNNMDPGASHVDLAEVERVEVSRGPFDVKNVGSLGGVVNVVTRRPEPGLAGTVAVSLGSFNYCNPVGTLSYGGERVSALAGASYRSSDPYRDGEGERFTEVANYKPSEEDTAAFRVRTGWAGLYLSPTEKDYVRLTYTRQEADHVLYPYLLMDGVFDNTDRFQAGYERAPGWGGIEAFRVQGYATHVVHWMTDALRTSSAMAPRGYSMGTYAETQALGGRAEAEWPSLTAGLEYTRREWDAQTKMAGMMYMPQYSVPGVLAQTTGLYGLYEGPVAQGLTLRAAARADSFRSAADPHKANTALYYAYHDTREVESEKSGASASLRFVWTGSTGFELSAGAGSVLRFPDPQELFFGLKKMGADWVGNPLLEPSRNNGLDASAAYQRGGFTLRANLFRDEVDGYVTVYNQKRLNMVPGVMNPMAKSYANVDATLWGGELSASAVLGSRFFLNADLAAVRGEKDPRPELGITSSNLAEVPPYSARATFRYDDGRFFAEAEGVFAAAQDRVDQDLEEEPTPGWGVCNLRAGLAWKGLKVTVAANNIFNHYYVESLSYQRDPYRSGVRVPEPGRSLTATVSFKF